MEALEPQLAIPVIVVVAGAILVYIFGFKQPEEPSYGHLAVLQGTTPFKNRSVTTNAPKQQKGTGSTVAPAIAKKTNGHIVTGNGIVKKIAGPSENKPAIKVQQKKDTLKTLKDPANKPEDFESGDWIPAVTRKEKIKKPKPEPVSPGKKPKNETTTSVTTVVKEHTEEAQQKAPKIEDVLAEMKLLEAQKEQTVTQTAPEKKGKKAQAPEPTSEDSARPDETVVEVKFVEKPTKEIKNNVAFDEMGGGDTWEEAKSRGAKKRRTRKD